MARRKERRRREPVPTYDYTDPEGNVLTLRGELTERTIAKLAEGPGRAATSHEDTWHRRTEMLFERLAVRWVIAGLPPTSGALVALATHRHTWLGGALMKRSHSGSR